MGLALDFNDRVHGGMNEIENGRNLNCFLPTITTSTNMAGINPGDEKLVFESSEAVKVVSTFDQLGLKEDLLRGIYAYGVWFFQIANICVLTGPIRF